MRGAAAEYYRVRGGHDDVVNTTGVKPTQHSESGEWVSTYMKMSTMNGSCGSDTTELSTSLETCAVHNSVMSEPHVSSDVDKCRNLDLTVSPTSHGS